MGARHMSGRVQMMDLGSILVMLFIVVCVRGCFGSTFFVLIIVTYYSTLLP